MAMTADPRFVPALRSPRQLASIFGLFGSVDAARRAARVYAELDALTDADLSRRGLGRGDIAAVAARELKRP